MKITDKYVLFWGSYLSNFAFCTIKIDNKIFYSAEQLFMHSKALLFNDTKTAELIINTTSPKEAKRLGRLIKDFDEETWNNFKCPIMTFAVFNKFNQNETYKQQFLRSEFDGKSFVEANPYDKIWGIGLGENDPRATDPSQWQGQNLLGKILDKVRIKLKENIKNV